MDSRRQDQSLCDCEDLKSQRAAILWYTEAATTPAAKLTGKSHPAFVCSHDKGLAAGCSAKGAFTRSILGFPVIVGSLC